MPLNPTATNGLGGEFVATDLVPITPADSDLAVPVRGIRCKPTTGTAGTLRITTWNGQVRNTEIAVGGELTVYASRIRATGTTATGLEGFI